MKKIKKFGVLLAVFILNFYNTCFADVVWFDPDTGKRISGGTARLAGSKTEPVNYVLIGILVLAVIVCAVLIIRRIIKKKKEKENDNK